MEQAIGIDLGTYNSCAAYAADEGRVEVLRSHYGPTIQGKVFPSFVRFDALGNPVAFGEQARREMATAPDLVVWGVKRLIGRPYSQAEAEARRFAYRVERGAAGNVVIRIGDRQYTPGEVSSLFLRWIKDCAETLNPFIVGKVTRAVVTHPAYFDALQTEQTKEAAAQAGFQETELIAEPVAAALAYGLQLDASRPQYIAALDWGAGTLDIAIVILRQGKDGLPVLSEARPAKGNVALGGIDMDDALLAEAVAVYGLEDLQPLLPPRAAPGEGTGAHLPDLEGAGLPKELRDLLLALLEAQAPGAAQAAAAPEAWSDFCSLRDAVEQAKIHLSKVPATRVHATYRGRPLEVKMARTSKDRLDGGRDWVILEDALRPLLAAFRSHVEFALTESSLRPQDLQHVLLIGGPMHMPCVQAVVAEVFRANPQVVQELSAVREQGFPVDPMEAVARGAALYARRMGAKLGTGKINRDYGVLLEMQGEVLLHDGDGVPCEVAFPGELSHVGEPGNAVSIGLYKVEKTPEGEARYFRVGNYQFVPVFGPGGRSRFQPILKAAADKTVSLLIHDLWSDDCLHLERLSVLDGRPIPKPHPIIDRGNKGEGTPPPPPPGKKIGGPPKPVSAEGVATLRHSAHGVLQVANSKLNHPRVQAEPGLRQALEGKVRAVKEALDAVPAQGSAPQEVCQRLSNRTTELQAFLETRFLLSKEEKGLLGG